MPEPEKPVTYQLSYPFSAFPLGVADVSLLLTELGAASLAQLPIRAHGFPLPTVIVVFAQPVSDEDKAKIAAVVAAHQGGTTAVAVAQQAKRAKIDKNTASLIANGSFAYAGKQFSMSSQSQFNTLTMFTRRNDGSFTYPVVRKTKDSSDSVSLAAEGDVVAFYMAQETAVRALLDSGVALIAQVNAATTVEQVNAVTDNR